MSGVSGVSNSAAYIGLNNTGPYWQSPTGTTRSNINWTVKVFYNV